MKFDVIVGNPPYASRNEGERKTRPLWQKFVEKSIELCVDDGHVALVHPSGWRNVDGNFKESQKLLKSKQMMYLEMHHFKEGQELFNVAIDFDWYVLKNTENNNFLTTVEFQDRSEERVDIAKLEFIPNGSFKDVMKLVAKGNEQLCEVLNSRSAYGHDKKWVSKKQDGEFIYPCIYGVRTNNEPTIHWSSTNDRGHFDIPKVIWGSGASGVMVDKKGEYGMTEFASAIVDNIENLDKIKKALESEKFIKNIMGYKHGLGDKYNRKVIATFRKDFWKEFI